MTYSRVFSLLILFSLLNLVAMEVFGACTYNCSWRIRRAYFHLPGTPKAGQIYSYNDSSISGLPSQTKTLPSCPTIDQALADCEKLYDASVSNPSALPFCQDATKYEKRIQKRLIAVSCSNCSGSSKNNNYGDNGDWTYCPMSR